MNAVDTIGTARKEPATDHGSRPNAVTRAALREARDIMSGKIKVEWHHPPATKEELRDELTEMLQEHNPFSGTESYKNIT